MSPPLFQMATIDDIATRRNAKKTALTNIGNAVFSRIPLTNGKRESLHWPSATMKRINACVHAAVTNRIAAGIETGTGIGIEIGGNTDGFADVTTAREFARRRIRDSLEELRAPDQDQKDLLQLWMIYGEDAWVIGDDYRATSELNDFLVHPASGEERDWQALRTYSH